MQCVYDLREELIARNAPSHPAAATTAPYFLPQTSVQKPGLKIWPLHKGYEIGTQ